MSSRTSAASANSGHGLRPPCCAGGGGPGGGGGGGGGARLHRLRAAAAHRPVGGSHCGFSGPGRLVAFHGARGNPRTAGASIATGTHPVGVPTLGGVQAVLSRRRGLHRPHRPRGRPRPEAVDADRRRAGRLLVPVHRRLRAVARRADQRDRRRRLRGLHRPRADHDGDGPGRVREQLRDRSSRRSSTATSTTSSPRPCARGRSTSG